MAKKKAERKPVDPNAKRAGALTPEEFVMAWQKCESNAQANEAIGLGASARAARLRKAGVKLRKFSPGRAPLDVKALNALIK